MTTPSKETFEEYIRKHKGEQEEMIENHDIVKGENGITVISPKQCKKMLAWNDVGEECECFVIAKVGCNYIAVNSWSEEEFLNNERFLTTTWRYCKPIPETKEMPMSEAIKQLEEMNGCKVRIVEGGE